MEFKMAKKKKLTGIKTWLEDDRPREKLLKEGAKALSNSELLVRRDESGKLPRMLHGAVKVLRDLSNPVRFTQAAH